MKSQASIIIAFFAIILVSCAPISTPEPIESTSANMPKPTATFTLEPTATFMPEPTVTYTPEPTVTSTPEPTATPAPVEVSGILFLDANGSGLRDETSFICPSEVAKPPSITYFFSEVAECVPGEVVTVMEPGLVGMIVSIVVDGEKISATTDSNGAYQLLISGGKDGQSVKLGITDPNADDVALAMRYINQWNKAVVIPAYSMNSVNIPEQKLNDTKVLPLAQGFSAKVGAINEIGFIQGYLTLPFSYTQTPMPYIWNYFDIDHTQLVCDSWSSAGNKINYNGTYTQFGGGSTTNPKVGVGGGHSGLDYSMQIETQIVNGGPNASTWLYTKKDTKEIMVFLWFQNLGSTFQIENGHLSQQLVNDESKVYRGQIIALSGNSGDGTRYDQLHFGLGQRKPSSGNNCIQYLDPFRTIISGEFQAASQGYWTVDNLPQFSK